MKKNNKIYLKNKLSLLKQKKLFLNNIILKSINNTQNIKNNNRLTNSFFWSFKKKKKICFLSASFKNVNNKLKINRFKINRLMIDNFLSNFKV